MLIQASSNISDTPTTLSNVNRNTDADLLLARDDATRTSQENISPETKNSLQDSLDTYLNEQLENIKSNYQTAWNMDLTQAYYNQQQAVIDAYRSASNSTNEGSSNSSTGYTETLTSAYSSLYDMHKKINELESQIPTLPEQLPEVQPITIQPVGVNNDSDISKQQLKAYSSVMMPTESSYLKLSA